MSVCLVCISVRSRILNKSSAVAEMGDRARAKWAEKWGTAVLVFIVEAGSPSNTMSPGPRPTSVPSGIPTDSGPIAQWQTVLQTVAQKRPIKA